LPVDADGTTRLPWPYTQSELAGMIGGSRQSVNRLLGDFAARGLIRHERDAIVLVDLRRLEGAAER
jgi:CRP-like cAMP-binding protein